MRIARRNDDGQVALETFIVFIPWFIITVMFFNLMFLLGSLMLNQATVNRGAQQAAALGCMPSSLQDELASRSGLGMRNVEVEAIAPHPVEGRANVVWRRDDFINSDGTIKNDPALSRPIPDCSTHADNWHRRDVVPSGNFIYVQASYEQALIMLLPVQLAGGSGTIDMRRSALTVGNSLEGEG